MPVNATNQDYDRMHRAWMKCRDAAAGQDAVHDRAEEYLPRLGDNHEDTDYQAYKERAHFYGATGRTVEGLHGLLFRKAPTVKMPDQLKDWSNDVTGEDVDLLTFVSKGTHECITVGRFGILVDHSGSVGDDDKPLTRAQVEEAGLRPFLRMYRAESIINWKIGKLPGGDYGIIRVVLQEMIDRDKEDDEFDCETVTQYRVCEIFEGRYRQRLFEEKSTNDFEEVAVIEPKMNGKPLEYVPFVVVNSSSNDMSVQKPLLLDLVNTNMKHYQIGADYYHGLHYVGLPTAWITGVEEKEIPNSIGPHAIWSFNSIEAKCGYLQVDAQGFSVLSGELTALEDKMASLGARTLAPEKRGVEAEETVRMKSNGENSTLSSIGHHTSSAVTKALEIVMDWLGLAGEVVFELSNDFISAKMSPEELGELVKAWQSGAISKETLFLQLKGGEIIHEDADFDEEEEKISSDMTGMNLNDPGSLMTSDIKRKSNTTSRRTA